MHQDTYTNEFYPFQEYMVLKIFVDSTDTELIQKYIDMSAIHNEKLVANPRHYDSGFDIYFPEDTNVTDVQRQVWVDYKIKCCAEMYRINNDDNGYGHAHGINYATGFYTYARSSISNTSLRLANNQGIIDSGYRGNLMAKLDKIDDQPASFAKFTRLMQICAPNLLPIKVVIVDSLEGLGETTERGTGGFGSTGV
jgi:dUTP pyrophosphatase